MRVRVGTSGYNYREWKPSFYPADLPASRMLGFYAERFSTVEINATFYRMPSATMLAGWSAVTPDAFTFALKAPQRITHLARLRDATEPLGFFCDVAQTLGSKLGPLLFQLPPSLKKDLSRLDDFTRDLPPALSCAFEFRHESWFAEDVYERLRARGLSLCIADTEAGATPAVATAPFGYFRLRAVDYSDDDLRRWVETMGRIGSSWREAFVFFKHEATGTGPALARRFEALVG